MTLRRSAESGAILRDPETGLRKRCDCCETGGCPSYWKATACTLTGDCVEGITGAIYVCTTSVCANGGNPPNNGQILVTEINGVDRCFAIDKGTVHTDLPAGAVVVNGYNCRGNCNAPPLGPCTGYPTNYALEPCPCSNTPSVNYYIPCSVYHAIAGSAPDCGPVFHIRDINTNAHLCLRVVDFTPISTAGRTSACWNLTNCSAISYYQSCCACCENVEESGCSSEPGVDRGTWNRGCPADDNDPPAGEAYRVCCDLRQTTWEIDYDHVTYGSDGSPLTTISVHGTATWDDRDVVGTAHNHVSDETVEWTITVTPACVPSITGVTNVTAGGDGARRFVTETRDEYRAWNEAPYNEYPECIEEDNHSGWTVYDFRIAVNRVVGDCAPCAGYDAEDSGAEMEDL